jgi:hypothetical protein
LIRAEFVSALLLSCRHRDGAERSGFFEGVSKPFSYQELHARIEALLRRTRRRPGTGRLRVGPIELDPLSRQVWLRGAPVDLSKKEFALLRALSGEPTRVFTREELLRGVWGFRARALGDAKADCRISINPASSDRGGRVLSSRDRDRAECGGRLLLSWEGVA